MTRNLDLAFGIDFGTTCSAVASCATAGRQLQLQHHGEKAGRPMPSCIAIDREHGSFLIGQTAWSKRTELSETYDFVDSIKRNLNDELQFETPRGPIHADTIASLLFKRLRGLPLKRIDQPVTSAVVAIPVGFGSDKRQILRRAAEVANIEISSFVSEPTAAFFANYEQLKSAHHIVVFDWGGGTLDVSVLRHENGRVYELATTGFEMGGNDIDDLLARHLHAIICRRLGTHITYEEMEPRARDLLRVRCEEAKRDLTDDEESPVHMNNYGTLGPCRVSIRYEEFKELISTIIEEAMACFHTALSEADLEAGAIDRVLMTGGSSNLRPIRERMRSEIGRKIYFPEHTAWDVAEGAAKLAASPGTYYANQYIGIVLSDGTLFPLLRPGDSLRNFRQSLTLGLVDSTEQARIVFGGSPDIENDEASRITVPFPSYNFMQETIQLDFEVDLDLVFRVTMRSSMRPDDIRRIWEYTRLKTYYDISEDPDA